MQRTIRCMGEEQEPMVKAERVMAEFDIPRGTLYRLIAEGRIPAHDETKSWHKRRQWRFKLSEVRAALGEPPAPPRT